MIANINWNQGTEYKGIASNRKENHFFMQYTLLDRKSCTVYGELRFYATQSRHYACFWLYGRERGCLAGGGYAGGYGYHRGSAAAWAAISGVGWEAVREALEAIGTACGIDPVVIEAHA